MPASDLGAIAIKEVLTRAQINAADVDEVIMGQVNILENCIEAFMKLRSK